MDRLLTIDDVADLLQMTPEFVEQQICSDHIEGILVGDAWRIRPSAVDDYIEARRTMTPYLRLVKG